MNVQKIIFDLDGTLVNTINGIAYASNYVLDQHGFPTHPAENYRNFVGYGLKKTILNALPHHISTTISKETLSQYAQELVLFYEDHPLEDTHLYDGILDLLFEIQKRKISFAIHTNKKESIASSISKHFFSAFGHIDLIGQSDRFPNKPDPIGTLHLIQNTPLQNVLFIGDTEVDADTAKNAGIPILLATWGFRSKEFLESLDCPLVHHPKDILDQFL